MCLSYCMLFEPPLSSLTKSHSSSLVSVCSLLHSTVKVISTFSLPFSMPNQCQLWIEIRTAYLKITSFIRYLACHVILHCTLVQTSSDNMLATVLDSIISSLLPVTLPYYSDCSHILFYFLKLTGQLNLLHTFPDSCLFSSLHTAYLKLKLQTRANL